MNIIINGGTGLIGKKLCEALYKRGDYILLLSRNVKNAKSKNNFVSKFLEWNYKSDLDISTHIEKADIIINLSGASIAGKRWNKDYLLEIEESRITTTKKIVTAINNCKNKPLKFICASATGYYGNRANELLIESSEKGNDFLANLCYKWENETKKLDSSATKIINLRTGIVLSKNDGALKKMLLPFKLFVGGPLGNGKQWFPWIHIDDVVSSILYTIDNNKLEGAINLVSPKQITMNQFSNSLGKILKRPSFFKVPLFALKIAVGKIAESLIASQRVVPQKLINSGYKFKFDSIDNALNDLIGKKNP